MQRVLLLTGRRGVSTNSWRQIGNTGRGLWLWIFTFSLIAVLCFEIPERWPDAGRHPICALCTPFTICCCSRLGQPDAALSQVYRHMESEPPAFSILNARCISWKILSCFKGIISGFHSVIARKGIAFVYKSVQIERWRRAVIHRKELL